MRVPKHKTSWQSAKADIQADLDVAIAKADAEISAKAAESEKAIAEIRAGALASVEEVAKDTAAEIVCSSGWQGFDAKRCGQRLSLPG